MPDNIYIISDSGRAAQSGEGQAVIAAPSDSIPQEMRDKYYVKPAPVELARRAGVRVLYNSRDITVDIAPWLLAVEFTDGLEKADDLQLTLWDDGRWRDAWMPDDGAKLTVEIHVIEKSRAVKMTCGTFSVDETEIAGPPNTATIRATSAYVTTALRKEKKTRAWEKITLKQIADTIAKKAGMTLFYSARNNPVYQRMDQKTAADLQFLSRLAAREGLRIKTADSKLIVYADSETDNVPPIETFYWGDGRLIAHRFTNGITTAYKSCVVKYRKPKAKKTLEYKYTPPDAPETGQTLRINEKCESLAEAQRVAQYRLKAANRGIRDGSIEIVGDVRMLAGLNVKIDGYGSKLNGNYAIEEARHSVWPYRTALGMRKI